MYLKFINDAEIIASIYIKHICKFVHIINGRLNNHESHTVIHFDRTAVKYGLHLTNNSLTLLKIDG